jgi:hypothetical protein
LRLLLDERLDSLLSASVAFELLPRAMAELAEPDDATLCLRVDYPQE